MMSFTFEKTPCKLVPVKYQEHEYGLSQNSFILPLNGHCILWINASPEKAIQPWTLQQFILIVFHNSDYLPKYFTKFFLQFKDRKDSMV